MYLDVVAVAFLKHGSVQNVKILFSFLYFSFKVEIRISKAKQQGQRMSNPFIYEEKLKRDLQKIGLSLKEAEEDYQYLIDSFLNRVEEVESKWRKEPYVKSADEGWKT